MGEVIEVKKGIGTILKLKIIGVISLIIAGIAGVIALWFNRDKISDEVQKMNDSMVKGGQNSFLKLKEMSPKLTDISPKFGLDLLSKDSIGTAFMDKTVVKTPKMYQVPTVKRLPKMKKLPKVKVPNLW